MSASVNIEICAGSVESAIAARQGGAHRIELCTALSVGGLTPSQGMIEYVKNILKTETFVLIRPRHGDFNYSRAEFEIMKSDIFAAKVKGADGIVVGMINTDGTVDTCRMKEIVEMAGSMQVTFHRAFDMTRDPYEALETIIGLGCHRILTSGQAASAMDGATVIARLVAQAGKRIVIMPGGGINAQNLSTLHQLTGATEFHTSASSPVYSRMRFRKEGVAMGIADSDEYSLLQTDKEKVAEICNIARTLF
ncbi:MAG: copper homeostasis protein CutC [Bacteroidales bacterium]|nr:copper homeostasis protein CutC [Bacteroidales bacterium]